MAPELDYQTAFSGGWQHFGGSSVSNHCDARLQLLYMIHFAYRNGSDLLRKRWKMHASSLRSFYTSVNSCGFTFSLYRSLPNESRFFCFYTWYINGNSYALSLRHLSFGSTRWFSRQVKFFPYEISGTNGLQWR